MHISVIGLGKLGLCTAACFAAHGHKVIGFDRNPAFMEALARRQNPIRETGLDDLLARAWENLSWAGDTQEAVAKSDASLIIVPTPSLPEGGFDNSYVAAVLREMAPALARKESFHVIDVVSTVMPGSCDHEFGPLLESLTGKQLGRDLGLVYNPEFIALGSVVHNFLNPDMVLIGASDQRSGAMIHDLYATTCENQPHIAVMSLVNAEITKLSLNCFVTMKISFANELSSVCENIPGADVDVITAAMGQDTRVGSKYLKGGLGFGGPCFPRDNRAFQALAARHGRDVRLSPSVVAVNEGVVGRIADRLRGELAQGSRVAVLGLSYKPHTHIVEESQGILLAQALEDAGYEVAVYDPAALGEAKGVLNGTAVYAEDAYDAARGAAAVVLMTDWPEFGRLDWERLVAAAGPGAMLIDAWRSLKEAPPAGFTYQALGLGIN